MNKKVYNAVKDKQQGYCYICCQYHGENLQLHHAIFGNGKRKQHESEESCFMLCNTCHSEVHRDRKLDLRLKMKVQERYFSAGYSADEVRERMGGRLYFKED